MYSLQRSLPLQITTIMSTMLFIITMCACTLHTHIYKHHVLQICKLYLNGNKIYESFSSICCLLKLCFSYLYMYIYPPSVQRSENSHPWSQTSLLPVFVNKVLLKCTTVTRRYILYGCFPTTAAE